MSSWRHLARAVSFWRDYEYRCGKFDAPAPSVCLRLYSCCEAEQESRYAKSASEIPWSASFPVYMCVCIYVLRFPKPRCRLLAVKPTLSLSPCTHHHRCIYSCSSLLYVYIHFLLSNYLIALRFNTRNLLVLKLFACIHELLFEFYMIDLVRREDLRFTFLLQDRYCLDRYVRMQWTWNL